MKEYMDYNVYGFLIVHSMLMKGGLDNHGFPM